MQNETAKSKETIVESYQILIECAGEPQQLALLRRFAKEGLKCKALTT